MGERIQLLEKTQKLNKGPNFHIGSKKTLPTIKIN